MPTVIRNISDIKPGDLYEDSLKHPCLCVNRQGGEISGISLVDGSYPRSDDLTHTKLRRLSIEEAWHWRLHGPRDVELSPHQRWWQDKPPYLINPAHHLENLYFFSLYQVEWNERVLAKLGAPILHEWHDIKSRIEDNGDSGVASISFRVHGKDGTGLVQVVANKTTNDWLFSELAVKIDRGGEDIVLIQNGVDVER